MSAPTAAMLSFLYALWRDLVLDPTGPDRRRDQRRWMPDVVAGPGCARRWRDARHLWWRCCWSGVYTAGACRAGSLTQARDVPSWGASAAGSHDRPVQDFGLHGGLAHDDGAVPACGAQRYDMDRVGVGIDEATQSGGEFVQVVGLDGADEDAALDSVTDLLQGGRDPGAGVVAGHVVADQHGHRHDNPVHGSSRSTQAARRWAWRCRGRRRLPANPGSAPRVVLSIRR